MKRCQRMIFRKPVKGLDELKKLNYGQCRGFMKFEISGLVKVETPDCDDGGNVIMAEIRLGSRWACVECGHHELIPKNQTRIDDWGGKR